MKNILIELLLNELVKTWPAQKIPRSGATGVCSIVKHDRITHFILSMKSLFFFIDRNLPIYIVDDGTLTSSDALLLNRLFPGIQIELQAAASQKMRSKLRLYPDVLRFRYDQKVTNLRKKLDPIFLNPFDHFIYIDTDVLFLNKPLDIIDFISKPKGVCYYTASPYENSLEQSIRNSLKQLFDLRVESTFNSGLLCISQKNNLPFSKLNKAIKYLYSIDYCQTSWLAEETALCLSITPKAQALKLSKYVNISNFTQYHQILSSSPTSIHYSGDQGLKQQFLLDSIKLSITHSFFTSD